MKTRLLLLLTALQLCGIMYAQEEIDPMRFFPTAVGNLWEYTDPFFPAYQEYATKDSIDEDGTHWVYFNNDAEPWYKIDTNYYVYTLYPYWRYYKLDADSGDTWMVYPETASHTRMDARVHDVYRGYVFGKETIIKEIIYYVLREGDTVITEDSWTRRMEILAMDIGEVTRIDAESGPERTLRGCIINGDTLGTVISIKKNDILFSKLDYHLNQNYPNPFNPSTRIDYYLPKAGHIKLSIYNMLGEEIQILEEGYKTIGYHSSEFNGSGLSSGIYIYRLATNELTLTRKALLLK